MSAQVNNEFLKNDGTFITLSQYYEDLTQYISEGQNYQPQHSYFECYNITYKNPDGTPMTENDLYEELKQFEAQVLVHKRNQDNGYNSDNFTALFADHFMDGDDRKESICKVDITIKSHNIHDGIGYTELYCHLPEYVGEESLQRRHTTSIEFNTIVIYYNIVNAVNGNIMHQNIPMGIYFTGKLDGTSTKMSNAVIKHNDTQTHTGSSYGLKICSRFITTLEGVEGEIKIGDNPQYDNFEYILTKFNESQTSIQEAVSKMAQNNEQYKTLLSIFKNHRTNVPYIKSVQVIDSDGNFITEKHWFVNGRDLGVSTEV